MDTEGMTLNKKAWFRYMARSIDLTIGAVFIGVVVILFLVLLTILLNSFMEISWDAFSVIPEFLIGIIIIFFYLIIEASMFSTFKTSLGKKIFGITVTDNNNEKLKFGVALKRNFLLWFRGMALSIPLLSIVALAIAYGNYTNNGITSWDKDTEVLVQFNEISTIRATLGILLFIVVMALNVYLVVGI